MNNSTERSFELVPVEHWTEIRENGELVATLFKTHHPTIPFEVFMKNGTNAAKRVKTIGQAVAFILDNTEK